MKSIRKKNNRFYLYTFKLHVSILDGPPGLTVISERSPENTGLANTWKLTEVWTYQKLSASDTCDEAVTATNLEIWQCLHIQRPSCIILADSSFLLSHLRGVLEIQNPFSSFSLWLKIWSLSKGGLSSPGASPWGLETKETGLLGSGKEKMGKTDSYKQEEG